MVAKYKSVLSTYMMRNEIQGIAFCIYNNQYVLQRYRIRIAKTKITFFKKMKTSRKKKLVNPLNNE